MPSKLPPGPRWPSLLQTVAWWTRPLPFLEHARARYGSRFTVRLVVNVPIVMVSDPEEIKEVFTAPPDVLHPGEGARILEPVVGPNSVILLDERPHLTQRKLLLPAFHGEKMARLTGLMREVADREVGSWPRENPIALHPRVQALTLEIILRAVFGLDEGERLDRLRVLLSRLMDFGSNPILLIPPLQRDLGRLTAVAEFDRVKTEADGLIRDLVDERRRDGGDRDDILAMLLAARHEDGAPMSFDEIRDELMTMLVAGHETTASELAWAFERLVREPRVLRRLVADVDAGGDEYVAATVQETLRSRPVIPNSAPRLVKQPVTIGGWDYEPGQCCVAANAYLVHHDPKVYDEPYTFRPERFLDEPPGTYTWIPFGGGRRRCLGASFAQLEMKVVLAAILSRCDVSPGLPGREHTRRRAITLSPGQGSPVVLRDRAPADVPPAPELEPVPA